MTISRRSFGQVIENNNKLYAIGGSVIQNSMYNDDALLIWENDLEICSGGG